MGAKPPTLINANPVRRLVFLRSGWNRIFRRDSRIQSYPRRQRLLGNDAAHVEQKVFDEIGTEELEVAIEFTKDLLRSTYQLKDLLGRLRALKVKKATEVEVLDT